MNVDTDTSWPKVAWPNRIGDAAELALAPPEPAEPAAAGMEATLFGKDGFTFGDLIDIINPIQHLPLAGSLYRGMSGDEIAAGPRVLGATLFFGPLGLAGSLVNLVVEDATGKDIGDHIVAFFGEQSTGPSQPTEMASLAGFETAAGDRATTAPAAEDPVSAWARSEAAWAASRASVHAGAKPFAGNEPQRAQPRGAQLSSWTDVPERLSDAADWLPAMLADAGGPVAPLHAAAAYRRAGAALAG